MGVNEHAVYTDDEFCHYGPYAFNLAVDGYDTYTITINDKASIHNFVLQQETGGKLAKDLSAVPFTGTNVFAVTLAKGKYKYYCRPHQSSMFGEFTVS